MNQTRVLDSSKDQNSQKLANKKPQYEELRLQPSAKKKVKIDELLQPSAEPAQYELRLRWLSNGQELVRYIPPPPQLYHQPPPQSFHQPFPQSLPKSRAFNFRRGLSHPPLSIDDFFDFRGLPYLIYRKRNKRNGSNGGGCVFIKRQTMVRKEHRSKQLFADWLCTTFVRVSVCSDNRSRGPIQRKRSLIEVVSCTLVYVEPIGMCHAHIKRSSGTRFSSLN